MNDTRHAIEVRLREALRAEADRCAAAEPARLAARCTAIPRVAATPIRHRVAWAWAAGLAAAAALAIVLHPLPPPAPPAPDAYPLAVPATEAQLARLHASIPHPPPVIHPPPPPRPIVSRLVPQPSPRRKSGTEKIPGGVIDDF